MLTHFAAKVNLGGAEAGESWPHWIGWDIHRMPCIWRKEQSCANWSLPCTERQAYCFTNGAPRKHSLPLPSEVLIPKAKQFISRRCRFSQQWKKNGNKKCIPLGSAGEEKKCFWHSPFTAWALNWKTGRGAKWVSSKHWCRTCLLGVIISQIWWAAPTHENSLLGKSLELAKDSGRRRFLSGSDGCKKWTAATKKWGRDGSEWLPFTL